MCKLCETKPVYEFTNQRKLCKICFVRWFQKKVLYTIRKFELIKSGDVVGYGGKGCFREVVLEDILKMFVKKAIVELVKLPTKIKLDKTARASNTDLEADKIVHVLIKGKGKINSPKQGNEIFPLYLFLDKEVLLYAKLRGLKFKEIKEKTPRAYTKEAREPAKAGPDKSSTKIFTKGKDNISEFINEMEKLHPEIKQAIVGSYLGN